MPFVKASAEPRSIPWRRTRLHGRYYLHQLARISILMGEPEKALDATEHL